MPGELTLPGLGLARRDEHRLRREVTSVIHCAASVSWDLPLSQAREINVVGTRRVLELAEEIQRCGRLDRLVHVSTAYVAGRHHGSFAETDLIVGQRFRNTYEQTKAEGELVVRRFADRLPIAVVRPSIVVGESDSGWTPAFNVIYWPLRAFARGLLRELPALPESRVDIVPVDYVADAIVHALYAGAATPGVLLATAGHDALTAESLIGLTCDAMGRERPRLVDLGADLPGGSDQAALYAQYFDMEVVFDDERSRAQLEPAGIAPPPLDAYFAPPDRVRRARALGQAPDRARRRAASAGPSGGLTPLLRLSRPCGPRCRPATSACGTSLPCRCAGRCARRSSRAGPGSGWRARARAGSRRSRRAMS